MVTKLFFVSFILMNLGRIMAHEDPEITEEDVKNHPYFGLMDVADIRNLLCHSNRHQTQSGFDFQSGCRECLKQGNHTHPRVWLLTMIPAKEECRSWKEYPTPSGGEYLAAHYVCLIEECGQRFTPAKWTSMDVHCEQRPHLPCEMTSATLADTCLRPERFIKQVRYELMEAQAWSWWVKFWSEVAPNSWALDF